MSTPLHRLGRACARRPRRVLASWLLAVLALTGVSMVAGGTYRDDMTAPGTSSTIATAQLRASFPAAVGARAHVVARWVDGASGHRSALSAAAADLEALTGVNQVVEEMSTDGRTAMLVAAYQRELPDLDAKVVTEQLTAVAAGLAADGAQVGVGGEIPESIQGPNGSAEMVGVIVAAVVLLLALGSVLAAGLPLLVAGAGLGAGMALVALLAGVTDLSSVSPTLGAMIGLGVGIDYALLVVARHRQELAAGIHPVEAAGRAVATAGRSVLLAALCVLLGLTGLAASGVPGFAWMGVAAGAVVVVTAVAAITLLPALLGLAGRRLLRRRARPPARTRAGPSSVASHPGWAERVAWSVTRRPMVSLVASATLLLALAAPALSMRLGQNDAGSEPPSSPTRQAYDLVSDGFGAGANGPLAVVIDNARVPQSDVAELLAQLGRAAGVASVGAPVTSTDGGVSVVSLAPVTGPQDAATAELVQRLQADLLPAGVELTGPTAVLLDTTQVLADNLWRVLMLVLGTTFVLLLLVFRSVLLPLKAVVVNLLSVAATYGVLTLAFQTELGARLIGLSEPVPIAAWAPMVLFAILFGLSMDYEVFMLSAVREQHARGLTARDSVVAGLGSTAGIITSAGAIMVAVALGFALDPGVMIKIIGIGLATAIVLDITLVRLVLVPAAMVLMGDANWWLPGWIARLLPPRTAGREAEVASGSAPGTTMDASARRLAEPDVGTALAAVPLVTLRATVPHFRRVPATDEPVRSRMQNAPTVRGAHNI